MKILITGALGHIGSKLILELINIKKIKKLYLIDNARSNNLNVLFKIKSKNKKIKFIYGDLLDKETLNLIKEKIDLVIHLASITNSEGSWKIKNLIYENNFGIFKNICKFCLEKKAKLIHLSSTSVYGIQSKLVDEKCKSLKPQSPYADIKLLEERYLQKNKRIKFISLRLGTITGISFGMRFHTAVNKFCLKAILREKIPVWNNAMDLYRPYLSLNDAIKVLKYIIDKNLFNREIYNILTKNYTVRQILELIKKQRFKVDIKKTNSPMLNQNSYKVSRKKFDSLKVKLNNNIYKDIKDTLNLIKYLY
tara:strand:- start:45 stop:968 length:924 start_codon:yes stop_codon:yes gene_type:complete